MPITRHGHFSVTSLDKMCLFLAFHTPPPKKRKLEDNPPALVPRAGLEPAHLAILVFETNASTNSATGAGGWGVSGVEGGGSSPNRPTLAELRLQR